MAQKNAGPKGRLYNKYQRVKSSLTKAGLVPSKKTSVQKIPAHAENLIECEADAEQTRLFLVHHREPWAEIKAAWKSCVKYRLSEIQRSPDANLQIIFQRWPLLKSSFGYLLVI